MSQPTEDPQYGQLGEIEDDGAYWRISSKVGERAYTVRKDADPEYVLGRAERRQEEGDAWRRLWEHLSETQRKEAARLQEERRRAVIAEHHLSEWAILTPSARRLIDSLIEARWPEPPRVVDLAHLLKI